MCLVTIIVYINNNDKAKDFDEYYHQPRCSDTDEEITAAAKKIPLPREKIHKIEINRCHHSTAKKL